MKQEYKTPDNILELLDTESCKEKYLLTWKDKQSIKQSIVKTCNDHYNCCDCGGNDCGCRYCFSCNACESCNPEGHGYYEAN